MSYSDSSSVEVTTTTGYDVNPEYIVDPPVSVYVESDVLLPSYHNTVIYTDTSHTTYETDGSCCLIAFIAGLCCCCSVD